MLLIFFFAFKPRTGSTRCLASVTQNHFAHFVPIYDPPFVCRVHRKLDLNNPTQSAQLLLDMYMYHICLVRPSARMYKYDALAYTEFRRIVGFSRSRVAYAFDGTANLFLQTSLPPTVTATTASEEQQSIFHRDYLWCGCCWLVRFWAQNCAWAIVLGAKFFRGFQPNYDVCAGFVSVGLSCARDTRHNGSGGFVYVICNYLTQSWSWSDSEISGGSGMTQTDDFVIVFLIRKWKCNFKKDCLNVRFQKCIVV